MIRVFETARADNFFEYGYLLANPDVEKSTKEYGHTGRYHYDSFGFRENRRQLTREFVGSPERRRHKYRRFHDLLLPDTSFSWIEEEGEFPVSSSAASFSKEDYARGESANGGLSDFLIDLELHPDKHFVDIGCGLRDVIYDNCLYIEVYPSICADLIVEPNCRYPLKDCSFDGVSCGAVLEHVTRPWLVVDEIHRILKPGGRCFIDWPFLQPVHGYPSHYYNATREGLRLIFADRFNIESLCSHPMQTPEFALYWLLGRFAAVISDPILKDRFRGLTVDELLAHPPTDTEFWKPLISTFTAEASEELACGNYLIATKRG